ncbi:hypothetical protein Syun_030622 [Stephania yunnanensis]|uniref:Uncharacterized protein n=1 Tax=Stephania yunnanensis TaxID=152371 RepID=A0AAP0DUH9_9MAGN
MVRNGGLHHGESSNLHTDSSFKDDYMTYGGAVQFWLMAKQAKRKITLASRVHGSAFSHRMGCSIGAMTIKLLLEKEPEDDSCFDEENEVEDEEHPVNFDKPPKFDFDNQDFIEDTVVFRYEGLFVKIIPWSTSSPQRETVANDAFVKKCSSEINARNEFAKTFGRWVKVVQPVDLQLGDNELAILSGTVGLQSFLNHLRWKKGYYEDDYAPSVFIVFASAIHVLELIGFQRCMHSCLEYLEVVPWVGDEEEEKVLSSVLRLKQNNVGVTPLLKRVSSDVSGPLIDELPM